MLGDGGLDPSSAGEKAALSKSLKVAGTGLLAFVGRCLTAGSGRVVVAEFSFLIDRGNLLSVPDVAEVPLLAGVGQKGWPE